MGKCSNCECSASIFATCSRKCRQALIDRGMCVECGVCPLAERDTAARYAHICRSDECMKNMLKRDLLLYKNRTAELKNKQEQFRDLLDDYQYLKESKKRLETDYYQLEEDYDNLRRDYDNLKAKYNKLRDDGQRKRSREEDLQSDRSRERDDYPDNQTPAISKRTHSISMQPVGMYPIGTHPVGTHPVGMHPVGTHPVGMHPVNTNQVQFIAGLTRLLEQIKPK